MPLYIISDKQIENVITNFKGISNLDVSGIKLKDSDRRLVTKFLNAFAVDGDGQFTTMTVLLPEIRRFVESPSSIEIPDQLLSDFIDEVNKIDINTHFPDFEIAFRLYFGQDNGIATGIRKYSIVMVPICSPKVSAGSIRDHSLDLENQLFIKHGKFFALVISEDQGKLITNDKNFCRNICAHKDPFSITELAYFSLEQFNKFRNGISSVKDRMSFTFCRTANNSITGFISFLGTHDELLESAIASGGVTATGTFFDQGDLVPPPNPVSDKSF